MRKKGETIKTMNVGGDYRPPAVVKSVVSSNDNNYFTFAKTNFVLAHSGEV